MRIFTLLIITSLSLNWQISSADVLIIDRINNAQNFSIPARGITMNQVITQFGEPQQKNTAVGKPPITKWSYNKFSVYFEGKWVINSVVHKANALEKGPKYIQE